MGVVYEAYDRERDRRIAVKTLAHFTPSALYLFKQEFRTLANVLHRNLVRFHDLVASESDGVFLTMELVSGVDFRKHVWRRDGQEPREEASPTVHSVRPSDPSEAHSGTVPVGRASWAPPDGRAQTPADIDRLRSALRQLAEGVHALHAAGKVHRDIKPSNVLVGSDGRLVLLDFGVAAEVRRRVDPRLLESNVVGTPVYMAPEQALDDPPSPGNDWYSVGVLLYEALVGKPPFVGDFDDVVYRKAVLEAPAPRDLVDGVPDDLDALCRELLRSEPDKRPNGPRVLKRLGVTRTNHSPLPLTDVRPATSLIGRSAELRALHRAYVSVRGGSGVVVCVQGASGMGKSALVQHFLDGLAARSNAVILQGCAYERESVAYKAVDGIVDALSRCLIALEQRGEELALPADVSALAHLFPVLRRFPAIAAMSSRPTEDPHQLRERACRAFREILSRLSRLGPLLVHVDDVQWGDVDSARLLLDVMRPPDAPPVMLILGYRDGQESDSSPFLGYWKKHAVEGLDVRDVPVEPLALDEARRVALDVLGSDDTDARRIADAIAQGCGGSAFFIEDLARSARDQGERPESKDVLGSTVATLDDIIGRRIQRVEAEPRDLLELVATHGRPIPMSILQRAAMAGERLDALVSELRERRFVRLAVRDGRELVETSHDRIRETVVARLAQEATRAYHRRLAAAYEAEPDVDPEAIVGHWFDAGEPLRAATYAERAAERACDKLAFDRAVHLYRLTRDAMAPASEDARRVSLRLAEALGWAGHSAEAATLYLEAARTGPAAERVALERSGAKQLLMCGEIDEGTRILRRALARTGRAAPESAWSAIFWLAVYGVWARIIGLRIVPSETDEVPARTREQIETLYAAVVGLGVVDALAAASLLARLFVLALRSRDRLTISAASLLTANTMAAAGGPESARERALVELGQRLAAPRGSPDSPEQAICATLALREFLRGHWRQAHELSEHAYKELPATRRAWNAQGLSVFGDFALIFLGEVDELAHRLPPLLADAEQRGDLLKIVNLCVGVAPLVFLAKDDPAGARRHIVDGLARWPQGGFLVPHWRALTAHVDVDLYEGRGSRARQRLAREARTIRRSFLTHAQLIRAITHFARARSAVAATVEEPESAHRYLGEAASLARKLESEGEAWTGVFASLASAAIANASLTNPGGERDATCAHLRAAIDRAARAEMALFGEAARFTLGVVLGGDEGTTMANAAAEAMRKKGVRVPDRYAAMLLPGRWRG
jgi:eukaryotic-like serine/threonine-protein kinase